MADQGSEGLLSPFLRDQRIRAARPYLNGKVLDIGCGSGALADSVDATNYIGADIDAASISVARAKYPNHRFEQTLELPQGKYDSIVALAVIEHVPDPSQFLATLLKSLTSGPDARIICTTPHPSMDWIHFLGSRVGIFSHSANEEHEELLDRRRLDQIGRDAGLHLVNYTRFLFGANQLAVYTR